MNINCRLRTPGNLSSPWWQVGWEEVSFTFKTRNTFIDSSILSSYLIFHTVKYSQFIPESQLTAQKYFLKICADFSETFNERKKWNIYIYILCTIYLISVFYNVVWNIAIVVRSISISQTKISIFIFQMFEINLCKWSWKFESLSIYLYNLTSSINLN